jgi:type IV pilus assembly protein PilO
MASDFVKELSRKPPATKAAILIAIMTVFGFLYYQFIYTGLKEDEQKANVAKTRASNEKDELTRKKAEMPELERRAAELQATIAANERALPTESELPSFFDHLQKKAGEAGVNIRKWDRQKEQELGDYAKVPVAMEVTGTFPQILKYFSVLSPRYHAAPEQADNSERLVTIEKLKLGSPKINNNEIMLTATFTASTFRQKVKPQARAPKAAPPKSKVGEATKQREAAVEKAAGPSSGGGDDKPAAATGTNRLTNPGTTP